ncbi:MAG: glyoxalase [Eubacteriales bacterium]|nr:glyoxalase [Eubacteriales bacterium]
MEKHIDECAKVFLRDQRKLFDEPVAENIDEAKEFLEDCFAQYFDSLGELKSFLEEEGLDISELSDDELEEQLEVFKLDNGGYFFVEA